MYVHCFGVVCNRSPWVFFFLGGDFEVNVVRTDVRIPTVGVDLHSGCLGAAFGGRLLYTVIRVSPLLFFSPMSSSSELCLYIVLGLFAFEAHGGF